MDVKQEPIRLYEDLRAKLIQEIQAQIPAKAENKSDETAIIELQNYLSLGSANLINQIISEVNRIATKTTYTINISTGFMSSKEQTKLTPFAEKLLAVLSKYNPNFLFGFLEPKFNDLLAVVRDTAAQLTESKAEVTVLRGRIEESAAQKGNDGQSASQLQQYQSEIKALKKEIEDIAEQKQIAEEKRNSAESKYEKLAEELDEVEECLRKTEGVNVENQRQLKELKESIQEMEAKNKKIKKELKAVKEENNTMKFEAVKIEAQLSTLKTLKDKLDDDLRTKISEWEKQKKELDERIKESDRIIAEQRELITKNQHFITDTLETTVANINQSMMDQSFNTSRVLRDNPVPRGPQNRPPSTASKVAASQVKVLQAQPAQSQVAYDNEQAGIQFKYITSESRAYLSKQRVGAIFAFAKFAKASASKGDEHSFCIESIKLLAKPDVPSYECATQIDKLAREKKFANPAAVVPLTLLLRGLPKDEPAKTLDSENLSKLQNALYNLFSKEGYDIPELVEHFPKKKVSANDASQVLTTPMNVGK